jgi:HlyD family secretion protein
LKGEGGLTHWLNLFDVQFVKGWWSVFRIVFVIGVLVVAYVCFRSRDGGTKSVLASSPSSLPGIACLGRLEPEDGVRHLAAPFSMQGPSILAELLVREGDQVGSNQVLAVTANYETFKADYEVAQSQVKVAQDKLTRIQTGEKAGDIAAQLAELQRAEAQWENAQREFKRDEDIRKSGGISLTELDRSRLAVETSRKDVERAREKLNSLKEIRDVDVNPALRELEVAVATARRASAELNRTQIRAPFAGRVIKIHARSGEEVGRDGVLELARTDSMFVHAEVYETDISRAKIGQRAEITGDSLTEKISGRVTEIGMKVGKNDVLKTDPAAYADGRVVGVKIRLDESRAAASLIHAQVNVRIFP